MLAARASIRMRTADLSDDVKNTPLGAGNSFHVPNTEHSSDGQRRTPLVAHRCGPINA